MYISVTVLFVVTVGWILRWRPKSRLEWSVVGKTFVTAERTGERFGIEGSSDGRQPPEPHWQNRTAS